VVCVQCHATYQEEDGIIVLASARASTPGYDPHYFATLPRVEETHFWFVHRREVILEVIRRQVPDFEDRPLFDVGCGSGGLLSFLERSGVPLAGACDAYVEGLRLARRRVKAPLVLVGEGGLPPIAPGQKMIGLFDVLEHLDDDLAMLRFFNESLEVGGALVITVPAHPFLFDEMDELAHHRRRYRTTELRDRLRAAGFEVRFLGHFMSCLVPLLLLVRTIGRLLPGLPPRPGARRDAELRVVPVLNQTLAALLRLESWLARWITLPFGTSLVAVARRPR
jgi:SAM-dependent methyltransferase